MTIATTGLADRGNFLLQCVSGMLFVIATAAISIQISSRLLQPVLGIQISVPWTEEIARYCFVWSTFLGAATLCRVNGLISIDMLVHLTPKKLGRLAQISATVVAIGFFVAMSAVGLQWTMMSFVEVSPVLRIPMAYIYIAMPVGGVIAIANLALLLRDLLRSEDIYDRHADVPPEEA